MKRVIVKRIGTGSLVKWNLVYSLIGGVTVGIIYATVGYIYSGQNLWSYAIWYGLGLPVMYVLVALAASIGTSLLFNAMSESSGGLVLDVDVVEEDAPPPPPRFDDRPA
jgi:uncharacterized membrane protein YgaE (UPF0421/DUF939 family)